MIIHTLSVGPMPTNCYIIVDQATRACAIIDPGGNADQILFFVQEHALEVKYILLTHPHFDHMGAAAEVMQATRAPLGMHADGIPTLVVGGGGARLGFQVRAVTQLDIPLADEQNLTIGELQLRVLHIPGHDAGHVVFHEPSSKVVFDGDVLFPGEIGQTNNLGCSYHQLMDSICRKLLTLPDETVIYPGHGPSTTIGKERLHNPWLQQYKGIKSSFSLVPLQANHRTRYPLFLVHPVGGQVFCYSDIARHLRAQWTCYGLQARGIDDPHSPYTSLEAMAAHYIQVLRSVQREGPFLLGGWAMGGVIAYEIAQQLQAEGQMVALLALIDSRAPTGEPAHFEDSTSLLSSFAQELDLPLQAIIEQAEHIAQREIEEQLAFILEQAKRAKVLPASVNLAEALRLYQVFENNLQALKKYTLRPYAGPITLFRAEDQEAGLNEDMGWGIWAKGGLTVQVVPGNHASLIRTPNTKTLVEQLGRHLRAAQIARTRMSIQQKRLKK